MRDHLNIPLSINEGQYFLSPLERIQKQRKNFSPKETSWMDQEIQEMMNSNVIELGNSSTVLNPINIVPKKGSDQFRFILDLRKVNLGIKDSSFKMDNIQKCLKFVQKGMWATKIDLKKGYFHVPIKKEHCKLLGFKYKNQIYQFKCLPFGLSQAPRNFTKIMKELVTKWRKQGILVFIYIDDILILNNNKETTQLHTDIVMKDLETLGWIIQKEKSVLTPCQCIEFLGLDR